MKLTESFATLTLNGLPHKDLLYVVQTAVQSAQSQLQQFAQKADFSDKMILSFGISPAGLQGAWANGMVIIPKIEIVSSNEIDGALGAFAAATDSIYLAEEFLSANINNLDAVVKVLLEEYGHYVDDLINHGADSPGDEGRIFSALVRGESLNQSQLEQLKAEDDSATVVLGGQVFEIEKANISDSGGFEGSTQTVQLESNGGGTAKYSFEFFEIPDQFIIRYEGKELVNTGFVSGNKSGQVQIPEGNSDQLQVIVATNDEGTLWEYSVTTEDCPDIGPFFIELVGGEFKDTDEDGDCDGEGTIYIGRTDGISQMLEINGKVEYDQNRITVDGVVSSLIGTGSITSVPLFDGQFVIDLKTGTTTSFAEKTNTLTNEFQVGGLDVDFSSLTINPNGLALGAKFEFLEELDLGFEYLFSGSDALLISQDDVNFGASVKFSTPNFNDFDLFGFLPIKEFSNFSIEYIAPEDAIKIQGKLVIEPFTKLEQVKDITIDLAGDNYIQIKGGNPDVKGSLSVETDIKLPREWGLKELKLDIDTQNKDVGGSTKVEFPFKAKFPPDNAGVVDLGLGFKLPLPPVELNKVSVNIDNLNIQLPIPGFPFIFFQRLAGSVENFAPSDNDPIEFSGGLGATLGPQIGGFSLIRLDLDGKISPEQATGSSKVTIISDKIGTATTQTTLNWNQKFYEEKGSFSFLDGLITTNSSFKTDSNFNINMGGAASASIPNFIPLFGGAKIGSGNFLVDFSNDGNLSNDFAAAWGELKVEKFGFEKTFVLGFKGYFDGNFERIGAKNIPPIGSYEITPDMEYIILGADWETEISDNVPIEIETPDGSIITEAEFEANNIAIIDELTDSTSKVVIIFNPIPGIWDIQVADETGLGAIQYTAATDSEAPTIEIIDPNIDVNGGQVTISYNAVDADSNAEIKLFYDNDNLGFDGILFADGLTEADGFGNFIWDTQGVATGEYFIYAMVVDENNPPAFSYSSGKVLITEEADLSVTQTTNVNPVEIGDNFSYTIAVGNHGTFESQGVIFTQTLPEEVTFVSASLTPSQQTDNVLTFDLGNLAAGQTQLIDITVTAPDTIGNLSSTATILSNTFDPDATNDVDTLTTTITDTPPAPVELSVVRTNPTDPISLGDDFTYTLTITNNGTSPATGVILAENLPSGVNFIDVTSSQGTAFTNFDGTVTAELGELNGGESATVILTVNAFTAGNLVSTTSITSNEADLNVINNFLIQSQLVGSLEPSNADLELTQTVNNPNPNVGDEVTFTLTLTNKGPGSATSVQVTNLLPTGLSFISATPEQGTYDSNTGIWNVGNIRDNLSRSIDITAVVTKSGSFVNTAEITSVSENDPDSIPNNNNGNEDDQSSLTLNVGTLILTRADNNIFQLSGSGGTAQVRFTLMENESNFVNEIGVFKVDNEQGSINGITPDDSNYLQTALENSQVVFSSLPNNVLEGVEFSRLFDFEGSDRLVFYLVQNSTTTTVLSDLTSGRTPANVLFALPSANNNSFDPLQISDLNNEAFTLAWKDNLNSSNNTFDDLVMNVQVVDTTSTPIGTGLQGQIELIDLRNLGTVEANFKVASEAAYNNTIGWYIVDDETGSIGDLKPGDAGYAQAAISERSMTHFTRDGIDSAQLQGLLAPYLIANSSRQSFLANNPNNTVGNGPLAYFAFMGANPDGVDHVRQLGDNTFGFEDLFNGGDKDYNDIIVQVNFA
ncbi:DUF4114 domain-containing protein [Anabaena sp. UHCC 0451]|uniref:DUF4114 domain-containing protein n=1 Tax=Anabaena sp. UHCC 0451 TaxID=2055235 RepID=UPI002B202F2A|nr:DUF4114 domain-containing protein [Anabaena sp. UHCC 0451]MEA5575068.1 DUF4114 domain-containing protein [Anabaena sp. UHCC 0451]